MNSGMCAHCGDDFWTFGKPTYDGKPTCTPCYQRLALNRLRKETGREANHNH